MTLLPIISTWMSIEGHRRLVQLVPDPVQALWNKCELRGLVLISLVSQMVLAKWGNRKRFRPNIWRRPLVWTAYLVADWVATFALGVITSMLNEYYDKGEQKDTSPQLIAFWAPFFLIHLGGPDTITAYALEDNELWRRHFVGLVTQTALTFYIILLSWKSTSWLSYLSIPVLIIGFIKYGERTWCLYSVSTEHLRDSLLSRKNDDSLKKTRILRFLGVFVSLFVDMILSSTDLLVPGIHIDKALGIYDFQAVRIDLGLMYDVFYTKAFAVYNFWGVMLRLSILFATANILLLHIIFTKSNEYLLVDCLITYMLLVGSLILELYSFILMASSDWTCSSFMMASSLWLDRNWPQNRITVLMKICEVCCGPCGNIRKSEDWERHPPGRADFLTLICNENERNSVEDSPTERLHDSPTERLHDVPNPRIRYDQFCRKTQEKIFSHFKGKVRSDQRTILPRPGYRHHIRKRLSRIPVASNLEFHQTIIAWHIATDLCYYRDRNVALDLRTSSKQLSDYMFYLLVKCRHMLPVGAGLLTYRHTFEDAKEYLPRNENLIDEACRDLLQTNTNTLKEKGSMSVFFHACTIAGELLRIENERERWEFLDELWIEILSYASANCRVDNHAQQLREGLEFLSQVWLLQAHLCLLEQFEGILMHEEERRVVACRESGHVVASWFLEGEGSLPEETILRRDNTGSWVSRCFPNENPVMTARQLSDKLCIVLGGTVAEEVLSGKFPILIGDDDYEKVWSASFRHFRSLDQASELLRQAEDRTKELIQQHKHTAVQIANLLFRKGVTYKEELVKRLGQPSYMSD